MNDQVMRVLDQVGNQQVKEDSLELVRLMNEVTGQEPKVWNNNTIGFGCYRYAYASGQEGEFFDVGFAPRKSHVTLYIMSGLKGFDDILERLGKHEASKSTIHIKSLADIDDEALEQLIGESVAHIRKVESELGAIPRMSEIPPRQPS